MNIEILHLTVIRTSDYLVQSGISMTTPNCRALLAMIDAILGECEAEGVSSEDLEHRLLAMAMDRLPGVFHLPGSRPPEVAPPLARGSVGYTADV
ncbi:MAG: hypothetical protein VX421_08145 [Pseudomonadota bacterium]|nr:hypothetical protein [Pseudomonadota bacterium]